MTLIYTDQEVLNLSIRGIRGEVCFLCKALIIQPNLQAKNKAADQLCRFIFLLG
jgi:hypothetical protein